MTERPTTTHILVVDDDARMRQVICWALEDEGYSVAVAADADEAVAAAARRRPTVVVLDCGLPDGDGARVARELRAVTGETALPIVLVTADGRASEKAARAGAVAYLHNPFEVDDFVRVVRAAHP
jgi:DNA-binding response OmpR family regulator